MNSPLAYSFQQAIYRGQRIAIHRPGGRRRAYCGGWSFYSPMQPIFSGSICNSSCAHDELMHGGAEMAALLCDFEPGDEVLMPSFTFVSTANAVVRLWSDSAIRGHSPRYVEHG